MEQIHQTVVLRVKPRVPIDFGIIEAENALIRFSFNLHIWIASEKLVAKSAIIALTAHSVDFIDDSADPRSLVQQHVGDDGLVGLKLPP